MKEWAGLGDDSPLTPHGEEEALKDLAQARSIVQKMGRLFEDNDYKFLHTMMQESLDAKVRGMLFAPAGMDGVVDMIFKQGKIAGFQEAMSFATILQSGAEGTIAQLDYLDRGEQDG